MSYIKRLKLQGFKSFANPTVLTFEKGFNTVVGANGSGKSNVFDAMCFVLGRLSSKELRTEKLGNLVFNGGKNLKPAKEAEVSIYLSNEDKELLDTEIDEVKISRVVSKDGQSKYLLNNQKVTRTEIVEVLRRAHIDPDGYNIILQGDIMRIVNMSPIERRELIEEISNISGYEEKREKAIKKLDKVELDLKEADLLMEEKTKYIKELKTEKEQAEKFHQVKKDLRFNSLLLVKAKIIRNNSIRQKKEEDLAKNEEELAKYKSKLDEFEEESKVIDEKIRELEKTIEIKSHNDFISVTNRITELEGILQRLNEKKSEYKKDMEELKTRSDGMKRNISENKDQMNKLEKEVSNLIKDREKLEKDIKGYDDKLKDLKKNVSGDSYKQIEEIEKSIDDLNQKKFDKGHIRQDNAIQIEKINTKLEHLNEEMRKIENLNDENKDQVKSLEKYREELKKLIVSISTKANQNSETAAKLNNIQKEYSELVESHSRLRMKADASRDAIATNKAIEAVSKFKGRDRSIHGTVAELASADEKYSLALETLSGKALFNIVVDDDKVAVKYINYLKENKIGSVTFLPLNKVNAKFRLDDSVLSKKGVIDYALNLIKFDRQYENIFHLIFGDSLVIERIEDAKGIGIGDYKMVTLDGDLVTKTGAMSGGFNSKKKGMGLFKDDKLLERLEKTEEKIGRLKGTLDHLKEQKDTSERELYDLRHKKMEVEGEVAKLEKILSIEGTNTDEIKRQIENILADKAVIENSLKKIDSDIKDLDNELSKLVEKKNSIRSSSGSHEKVMSEINDLEDKRDAIKEELMKINSEIDTRNININNVLRPETSNLEKFLKENQISTEKMKTSYDELVEEIKTSDTELKEQKAKEKELTKGYKGLIGQRDELREDKKKLEGKYEKEFTKFDSLKEKSSQLRYGISEYETLNKTLDDELEVLYSEIRAELIEVDEEGNEHGIQVLNELLDDVEDTLKNKTIDVKELQSKVNNLKTRMNSFGSINMKAVEIYDKLNDEFNKLLEKRETLNTEKAEILSFVAEMDEKKKIKFMETFTQLREHFVNIFSKLSTKGVVELNIENEKDLFNSGVEIKVKLSEKNYLDIKSLSGGEKTITAIAFIFAVQEFNPASFYIFDEVDAALDIMNSEKLGKLIKDNALKAQYIVVSHSEYLIQSAETIYGVTMDKNKISSVVSLDLRDMKDYVDTEVAPSG